MVTRTLTCENPNCTFKIKVESKDRKAAEAIFDYGKVNPVLGKPFEFNCLSCGHPLKKLSDKKKPSEILSDESRKGCHSNNEHNEICYTKFEP